MRLGHERVALRKRVKVGVDEYGTDIVADRDTLIRWCQVEPTRSTESDTRSAPAVAGATVRAPRAVGQQIESADVILWPLTGEAVDVEGRTVYAGRQWEVVGDVGLAEEYVETQIRRTS